ncbi:MULTISPECIES: CPBP family intramembrane glutamic endopeptidase [unclassified Chryseobacterium]|uniref:CPBP family intramembrane glutamic endopeptidase n=1 Tax=unclassified Chryseobacterium TaxID=2593645 RepID=UPI000D39E232|nr:MULTISPECIES: CPBP family intramembrane glutamic endopeptidase [unclassified Chryseobacterium]PTT75131.1 CPBP family intramembrane metalloprotease [Chryseobacterium sp. HMWF001]PVV50518.1 CPBP family intramembrane metalloprotease [Chryseobacterium sp. HMWF035]
MKNIIKLFVVPILSFLVYSLVSYNFEKVMNSFNVYIHCSLLSYFLVYVLAVIPLFVSIYIITRENIISVLGLDLKGFGRGISLAGLFIIPMLVYGLLFSKLNSHIDPANLFAKSFLAGLFEEIIYRAFIFGVLYRFIKLGFLPSIAIASFIFALGHLYQGSHIIDLVEIFLLTFLGSILYAWLYTEWSFNLWVPILLHSFMNLIWMIFDFDNTVIGSWGVNICRLLTVSLSIIYTVKFKIKNNIPFVINKNTLWRFLRK